MLKNDVQLNLILANAYVPCTTLHAVADSHSNGAQFHRFNSHLVQYIYKRCYIARHPFKGKTAMKDSQTQFIENELGRQHKVTTSYGTYKDQLLVRYSALKRYTFLADNGIIVVAVASLPFPVKNCSFAQRFKTNALFVVIFIGKTAFPISISNCRT